MGAGCAVGRASRRSMGGSRPSLPCWPRWLRWAPARTDETFAVWPPLMPRALELDSVPLGRWAQYEETYLGSVTIKERVALVGKGADGDTIETTTEMPSGEKTIFATLFAPAPDGGGAQVAASVFQVSDADPMQSPPVPPAQ